MSDWRAPMTPQNATPGQLAYTFLFRILSTSLISVSIFSVCCYSRVSILVEPTKENPFSFVLIHLSFNSQQGPPFSGLSVPYRFRLCPTNSSR